MKGSKNRSVLQKNLKNSIFVRFLIFLISFLFWTPLTTTSTTPLNIGCRINKGTKIEQIKIEGPSHGLTILEKEKVQLSQINKNGGGAWARARLLVK